jgi:hypothetical protein
MGNTRRQGLRIWQSDMPGRGVQVLADDQPIPVEKRL